MKKNPLRALFDDRHYMARMLSIALPIALQNLINFGVSAADTLMVGFLGDIPLSATAISNNVSFMFMIISTGVASGCGVLVAQHWGKRDIEEIKKVMALMYRVVACIGVLFTAVSVCFPDTIIRVFITDELVVAEAVIYLRVVAFGYLVSGLTNATTGILRSVGKVKISVVVYSASLLCNILLNWTLIFGHFGAPALGILGAAIATLCSRILEAAIALAYVFCVEKEIALRAKDLLRFDAATRLACLKYSTPVLCNEIIWSVGSLMVSIVIGRMGREFVAANSIAGVMFQMAGVVIFGVSAAAGAIVGNTIGAGDYKLARKRAELSVVLAVGVGLVCSAAVGLVRVPLIRLYKLPALSEQYALEITAVLTVYVFFQAVSIIQMMGILRGGGDTRFVMIVDTGFIWAVALPLGALCGLVWKLPIPVVYAVLKCEDLFKTFIALWRIRSGRWLRDLTTKPAKEA